MKPVPVSLRMTMVACAMMMLLAQLMGLHFHRHAVNASAGHATSLHLRDAGTHVHEAAGDHHAIGDRASHPDEDVEIDPLGQGLAKYIQVLMAGAWLAIVALFLVADMPPPLAGSPRIPRRHPPLFALRPPSHAPPPELSLAR